MILIVSHAEVDMPSDIVSSWILYLGSDCLRLNGKDLVQNKNSVLITSRGCREGKGWVSSILDVAKISSVWMRRWIQSDHFRQLEVQMSNSALQEISEKESLESMSGGAVSLGAEEVLFSNLRQEITLQRRNEFKGYSQYLFEILGAIPTLGSRFYSGGDPNKAVQMRMAQEAGLVIPDTLITNSRDELRDFAAAYPAIICKNISEIATFYYSGRFFITYTTVVTQELIDCLPERFYLSIFQEAIDKEFEIRVFYLNGRTYSMAIFSATDPQTSIDFRVYNGNKPNRTVPFKLPAEIERKVIVFMEGVGLVTGSLDLLYSRKGEYVFLEVNPVGQFGMVSMPCNYNLEKAVAEYLIKIASHG